MSAIEEADDLYRINDVLTALVAEFHVPFDTEEDEDSALNDLTHGIAERFRVGPYRIGTAEGLTTP